MYRLLRFSKYSDVLELVDVAALEEAGDGR